MHARAVASLLMVLTSLTACGGGAADSSAALAPEPSTTAPTSISPSIATTTSTSVSRTTVPQATTAVPTTTATSVATTTMPDSDCVLVEDFGEGAEQRWRVVNDGVMGGLSDGTVEFADGAMRFAGVINTNGGGFSSVRFALPADLGSATELLLRARSDGRAYEVQLDDSLDGRNRRITHFGPIPLEGTGEWETVRVDLENLEARVFGRTVDAAGFRADLATSVGVILADGNDGPFTFEIDRLEACS